MAAQPQSLISENQAVVIRRVTPDDAAVCGRIGFEAFATLANKHNFPPDFPTSEHAAHVLSMMFSHPSFFCVVAEQDGKIIGSKRWWSVGPFGSTPGATFAIRRSISTDRDALSYLTSKAIGSSDMFWDIFSSVTSYRVILPE
jgi:hypothetical protein